MRRLAWDMRTLIPSSDDAMIMCLGNRVEL